MKDALKTITSDSFLSVFILTICLILIGYFFSRSGLFKEGTRQSFKNLELYVVLPCLAFVGFVSDFQLSAIGVLIFSFIAFALLFALGRLFRLKYSKEQTNVYRSAFALSLVSMYGQPISEAIFGTSVLPATNMVLIAFRFYLYIYAYYLISGAKLDKANIKVTAKKIFLSPMMIAMALGLFVWLSQSFFFQVQMDGVSYSALRIDKTVPWLYQVIKTIGSLAVPIGMLLVGISLGKTDFRQAFTSKTSYLISFCRVFIAPALVMGFCALWNLIFASGNGFHLDANSVSAIVLCFGSPMSVVLVTYCVAFQKEEATMSSCVLLTTLFSLISTPLFVFLTQLWF